MRKRKAGPVLNYRFVLTRQYSVNAQSIDEAYALFKDAAYDYEFTDDVNIIGEHTTRVDPVQNFVQNVFYLDDDGKWNLVDDRLIIKEN